MTEEKKKSIRKKIMVTEIVSAVLLSAYLVYEAAIKNSGQLPFRIFAVLLIGGYVFFNDFLEPYLTKMFEEMNEFRKEAYKKYVLWELLSMGGLLAFALTFTAETSMGTYLGAAAYILGLKQKRTYLGAYRGEVTEADVEAAKKGTADEIPEKIMTESDDE